MKSQLHTLGINDRICMSVVGKSEPYNIVRCLDICPKGKACELYLSLLRKAIKVSPDEPSINTHLLGEPIRIVLRMQENDCVVLEFSTPSTVVKFKPLRNRESYVPNKSDIRDGSDVRGQEHAPPTSEGGRPR